jgi:hypothetical protein
MFCAFGRGIPHCLMAGQIGLPWNRWLMLDKPTDRLMTAKN